MVTPSRRLQGFCKRLLHNGNCWIVPARGCPAAGVSRMIVADRGVSGIAYGRKEISEDGEALDAADRLAERILELGRALHADGA